MDDLTFYIMIGLGTLILIALIVLVVIVLLNMQNKKREALYKSQLMANEANRQQPAPIVMPAIPVSPPKHDRKTMDIRMMSGGNQNVEKPQQAEPVKDSALPFALGSIPRLNESKRPEFHTDRQNERDYSPENAGKNVKQARYATISYDDNGREVIYEMRENCIVVGRDSSVCDIVLQGTKNAKVSRCHMIIRYKDHHMYLVDLNSTNKTFLNDIEVNGRIEITGHSTIRVASSNLKVFLG